MSPAPITCENVEKALRATKSITTAGRRKLLKTSVYYKINNFGSLFVTLSTNCKYTYFKNGMVPFLLILHFYKLNAYASKSSNY